MGTSCDCTQPQGGLILYVICYLLQKVEGLCVELCLTTCTLKNRVGTSPRRVSASMTACSVHSDAILRGGDCCSTIYVLPPRQSGGDPAGVFVLSLNSARTSTFDQRNL